MIHDYNCLCTECEIAREQSSHDAEINRIADALGLEDLTGANVTVEEIIAEIKRFRAGHEAWLNNLMGGKP